MKKIMVVFGTRPEAIKMAPVVKELQRRSEQFKVVVCVTGQHREMLDAVLDAFGVVPDFDLSVMKRGQTLYDITARVLIRIREVLEAVRPDVVLVHGDTSTTFAAALGAFYMQIPVGHVEAGLRTYNLSSPYPEEFNRQTVSILARYHFAPTRRAADNLLREGKDPATIFVTGNTVVDAMRHTVREDYTHPELAWVGGRRLLFITDAVSQTTGSRCGNASHQIVQKRMNGTVFSGIQLFYNSDLVFIQKSKSGDSNTPVSKHRSEGQCLITAEQSLILSHDGQERFGQLIFLCQLIQFNSN